MVRRTRGLACATVLGATAWLLSGCGGQSNGDDGGSGKGGGSGGSGTSGGASGCEYNGVRYQPGDVFGECKQCACSPSGGVACDPIGCDPGAGGAGGATSPGGAAGSVSASTGGTSGGAAGTGGSIIGRGCELGDSYYASGSSWPSDCNTCYCKDGTISCTMIECNPGSGGAGGTGGSAGSGAGGEAGSPSSCTYEEIRSFCVLGTPSTGGQAFEVGTPIMLSVAASGCHSSSCTKLVSSDCNYLSNGNEYMISTFLCLATEGDLCTDDCVGVGDVLCDPGVTFSEPGIYTISIRPELVVKLEVPSVVERATDLCADLLTR